MNSQIAEFNGSTKLTINTEQSRSVKIDAYSPPKMAERVEKIGVTKAKLDFWTMWFWVGLCAGIVSALVAQAFLLIFYRFM